MLSWKEGTRNRTLFKFDRRNITKLMTGYWPITCVSHREEIAKTARHRG